MTRKGIVLFFALLLPVLIFLFLKFFGKNEFDIPVLHQSNPGNLPPGCDLKFPYSISDRSAIPVSGPTVVFFMNGLDAEKRRESETQLDRLTTELNDIPSLIRVQSHHQDSLAEGLIYLENSRYAIEKECYFLSAASRIVLVDSMRRIRGYFEEATLKETDRLIVELKILLNEYE